jgi:branched-chain amino acid transport system substrate-binding protein
MTNTKLAFSLLAAALVAAGCSKETPQTAQQGGSTASAGDTVEIKIGHVAPLTGGNAHLGKDNENGARLAIEEANAANIKIGGKTAKFVLVAEDD